MQGEGSDSGTAKTGSCNRSENRNGDGEKKSKTYVTWTDVILNRMNLSESKPQLTPNYNAANA